MNLGYRLSPLAERDIEEIAFYIGTHNQTAAHNLVDRFFEAFSLLAERPEIGRKREDFQGLRSVPVKPYLIFYRTEGGSVEVVRVLHMARDLPSLLQGYESD